MNGCLFCSSPLIKVIECEREGFEDVRWLEGVSEMFTRF
jgi:hypothetical protein